MSATGLLGRALLGGVQGAGNAAYQVGEKRREREGEMQMLDLRDQKARALEQMRADSGMKQAQFEADQRSKEAALDRASRERIAKLGGSGKPYLDPMFKARLDAVNSEIEALTKRDFLEDEDRTRLTQLQQQRDTMLKMNTGTSGSETTNDILAVLQQGGIKLPGQQTPEASADSSRQELPPADEQVESGGRGLEGAISLGKMMREEGVGGLLGRAMTTGNVNSRAEMQEMVNNVVQRLSVGDTVDPELARQVYPHLAPVWQRRLDSMMQQ